MARAQTEDLIRSVRAGRTDDLGPLLERYRNYLKLLARLQLHGPLRARVDPSDVAQETFVDAVRGFSRFRGSTEAELVAWLRRVLARNLADQIKRHQAARRRLDREVSLEAALERSSITIRDALARDIPTPSERVSRHEEAVILGDAIERLPERYRDIIALRHFEHVEFKEIASRLGISSGAARMTWARAIARLRTLVDERRGEAR